MPDLFDNRVVIPAILWLWIALTALVVIGGLRYLFRVRARDRTRGPRVDDAALRRILETGVLPGDDDEPLDMDEAARAEADFWSETWDEPEEYHR